MANNKCIKCGYELFPLDKECDRCGTEVACTPAPADMNTSKTKDSKPKRSKNQKSPTDFDIKEAVKIKVTNTINSESSKKSSNKKTLIIIFSILSVAIVAAIVIVFIKKNTTAPANIAEVVETEPEEVTVSEITEQKEEANEETEPTDTEKPIQQEEVADTKDFEDWLATLQTAPMFVTWNTKTNEKNVVAMDGEYILDDDTKLILFKDTVNVGKMEFLPDGVIENNTIQNKGKYYIVPIMLKGKNEIEAAISYDSSERDFRFNVINNSTELPKVVESDENNIISDESLERLFEEAAQKAEVENHSIAVIWNNDEGTMEIQPYPYNWKEGDKAAIVLPEDFMIVDYEIDPSTIASIEVTGNIAYLYLNDIESKEKIRLILKFYSEDGQNINGLFSVDLLQNCQSATALSDEQISVWFDEIAKNCEHPEIVVWNKDTGTKEIMPNKYEPQEGDQFAVITNFEIGDCKPQVTKGKVEATIVDTNRIDLYYNFTGISGKVDTVVVTTPKNKENDSIDPYAMGSFMITNGRK